LTDFSYDNSQAYKIHTVTQLLMRLAGTERLCQYQ